MSTRFFHSTPFLLEYEDAAAGGDDPSADGVETKSGAGRVFTLPTLTLLLTFSYIFSHMIVHMLRILNREINFLFSRMEWCFWCSKKTSQKREGSDVCCAESGMYLKNKKKKDIEIEWAEALKMKRDGKKSTRSWAWRQQNSTWQAKSSSSSINVWGELGKDDDEKLREKYKGDSIKYIQCFWLAQTQCWWWNPVKPIPPTTPCSTEWI